MRVGDAHKRRKKAKESGGLSNKNAKIPTYHDSFEVKSTKAKGKKDTRASSG